MEQAIKIAIENGYKYHCGKGLFNSGDGMECGFSGVNGEWAVWTRKDNDSSIVSSCDTQILDKDFWQALGKGLGWQHEKSIDREGYLNGEWVENWHRFIDHLASGKDIDPFFTKLIK